ncbi:efflux RND transporter permease subunit [Mesorhizobium atlanticum]
MVNFFVHRPIFASAIAIIMVLAGAIAYFLLPVSQFPDITPPQVVVSAPLSRRQRAGRGRYGHHAARAADQRRPGHDLHVVDELE